MSICRKLKKKVNKYKELRQVLRVMVQEELLKQHSHEVGIIRQNIEKIIANNECNRALYLEQKIVVWNNYIIEHALPKSRKEINQANI